MALYTPPALAPEAPATPEKSSVRAAIASLFNSTTKTIRKVDHKIAYYVNTNPTILKLTDMTEAGVCKAAEKMI